jgi:S-adenosyl-L-methionine hydrolase (adenosine-forming)
MNLPIITLMTDFGIKDGNVGVMKGVILGIAPRTQIVDLSHVIEPQNVREAALILARSAPFFPPGSVHVVVVDPGVGTTRRPLAARLGEQYFVGPDNGIISILLEACEMKGQPVEFVHLDKPQYWLRDVSYVFHGRDIFSPVAAHLSNSKTKKLSLLGTPIQEPVRISIPRPLRGPGSLKGEILHVDHFGNAASNIRVEHALEIIQDPHGQPSSSYPAASGIGLEEGKLRETIEAVVRAGQQFQVGIAGQNIEGVIGTFGEREPGEVVALFGSTGNLIVSVVNGSAARTLHLEVGQPIELRYSA